MSGKSCGSILYRIMKDLCNIPVELQLLLYAGKAVKRGSKLSVKGIGGDGNDNNGVVLGKLDN